MKENRERERGIRETEREKTDERLQKKRRDNERQGE